MSGEEKLPVVRTVIVDDSPVMAERMEQILGDLAGALEAGLVAGGCWIHGLEQII